MTCSAVQCTCAVYSTVRNPVMQCSDDQVPQDIQSPYIQCSASYSSAALSLARCSEDDAVKCPVFAGLQPLEKQLPEQTNRAGSSRPARRAQRAPITAQLAPGTAIVSSGIGRWRQRGEGPAAVHVVVAQYLHTDARGSARCERGDARAGVKAIAQGTGIASL